MIGKTNKLYWLTALGAPIGALLGTTPWLPPWAFGSGPKGMVFTTTGLAVADALVGPATHSPWSDGRVVFFSDRHAAGVELSLGGFVYNSGI